MSAMKHLTPPRVSISEFSMHHHCRPSTLAALLLIIIAGGCDRSLPESAALPAPVVEIMAVETSDIPIYHEWIGTLDGMVNAQITAQVSGYLIKQVYQEGQRVKKGELLYEIDPRVFQAMLDGARSNLARQEAVLKTAQLDVARVERLLPEKAVSVRDRDNAVGREASALAEVMAARAAVDNARLQLEFTRITAPIDGIAGISKAQIGDLVGPGSPHTELTTVSKLDPIKAYIPLSEQQYLQLARERQQTDQANGNGDLELILADGSVYSHPGKFFFADRQVDVKTGTIQVAILFPNPNNLLRPGQFAKVRAIVKHKANALLVPQRAVLEMQGRRLLAVIKSDNSVEMRPVTLGETVGNRYVIEQGLQAGDRIVVEGLLKVRPGMTVDPKPYPAATSGAAR
ncbi:efflux RND transporter periplasmic adaptor subunit [Methylotuvimicrobium sp.]|uniref:efflux RND transporter periplasmic adaptor subunit n=2 Tax=Methylotuvimicrobium sp. TaxID=2822413 RepID=UPI003D64EBB3